MLGTINSQNTFRCSTSTAAETERICLWNDRFTHSQTNVIVSIFLSFFVASFGRWNCAFCHELNHCHFDYTMHKLTREQMTPERRKRWTLNEARNTTGKFVRWEIVLWPMCTRALTQTIIIVQQANRFISDTREIYANENFQFDRRF